MMENLLADMKALAVQNKTVALMENGTGTDDGKADERKTGGTEKCDDSGYADHHKIGDGAGAGRTA